MVAFRLYSLYLPTEISQNIDKFQTVLLKYMEYKSVIIPRSFIVVVVAEPNS